jgi:hypothetical protein
MTGHVSADHRRIAFAARIEAARVVAHAGFGLFRLGVSKQYQAHGSSIDVPPIEGGGFEVPTIVSASPHRRAKSETTLES